MIKLVQGFDVCSPLPIDGRILLSKKEMYEIDDNILPEKYFAICKEDGRLYLYNKFNVITEETGKWRLADNTTDERITREVKTLNRRIDNEVKTLNNRVSDEVDTLNDRIDSEVESLVASQEEDYEILDSRISSEVATLNNTINTKEATLQAEDARLDQKIDNYKEDKDLINKTELTETLVEYSLGDEAGTTVVLSMDTTDYILKIQLFNRDGDEISSSEVNTPLEEFVIDAEYDEENKMIILHLKNGHDVEIPIGSLISDLVDMTTFDAHVNNDNPDVLHITTADRTRWNNLNHNAVVKYDASDPENDNSLLNQLDAGNNVGITVLQSGKVQINATDTRYHAGAGINIDAENTISTTSASPRWAEISRGYSEDSPLDNQSLKHLFDNVDAEISNTNSNLSALSQTVDTAVSDIANEITRAQSKESELETAISDEETRATNKENELEGLINNVKDVDIAELKSKDIDLEEAINTEKSRAESAEENLLTSIEGEATTRQQADETLQGNLDNAVDRITAIEEKIPTDASSSNQLADKEFVNSSIATATAVFIGTFDSLDELEQQDADDNDYGFVVTTDAAGNTVYKRYKYSDGEWLFEYDLNNSSFTAEQWEAINSGINAEIVANLESDEQRISDLEANKVDKDSSKSLVDNTEIARLSTMATGSTKVAQSTAPGNGDILVTTRLNGVDEVQTVNVYKHPSGEAESLSTSFRKFSTDSTSHIKDVASVVAKDITDLNPYEFSDGLSTSASNGVVTVKVSPIIQVTVATSAWRAVSGGFGYQATVTANGLKTTSEPTIDINLANATSAENVNLLINGWSNVYRAVTADNSLTLYATNIPEVNLPINIKGY